MKNIGTMTGFLAILTMAGPATADDHLVESSFSLADTRQDMEGSWRGSLDYRDYRADRWFGIPVTVDIEEIGDGVTHVRKSAFDDGPARGIVYITGVSMLSPDGKTEYIGTFRADRAAESYSQEVRLADGVQHSASNWTVIAERDGQDDNRPARIRETTMRQGDKVTTIKEIDFSDDEKSEWLKRNRIVLERVNE